ncbi:hypothetical protein D3C78_1733800 [compost metagenome]
MVDLAQLFFDQHQHRVHRLRDLVTGLARLTAALEHAFVGLAHVVGGADDPSDDAIQVVDEAVDPAPHVAGFVVRHA